MKTVVKISRKKNKYFGWAQCFECPVCKKDFWRRASMGAHYAHKHNRDKIKKIIKVGKCILTIHIDPNNNEIAKITDLKGHVWNRTKCFAN